MTRATDHPDTGGDARSIVRRSAMPRSIASPLVTPIMPSVVYATPDADALDAIYEGSEPGFTYAREGHPNAVVLGRKLDWLEGVTAEMGQGTVTGSGMAAVSTMVLALLRAGDHVVAGDQLYGRSLRLLNQDLPRFGIGATLVDPTSAEAIEAAIRPETRMILVEVVSNPTLRVADLSALADLAARRGLMLAVDNTFTTPRAFRPLAHGAHVVLHSVTKLLAGHSDVTLGWVAADTPERNAALRDAAVTWGMTPSPFDCWLAERGLHSFDLRFDRASANAAALADLLADMAGVTRVLYPGRPDHPDHARAASLLGTRAGTMVSFELAGGRRAVNRFLHAAARLPFAPTLGDVATTVSHPASSSHRALSASAREALGVSEGFLRVSVGIEDIVLLAREFSDGVRAAAG